MPLVARAFPERGMGRILPESPFPIGNRPHTPVLISARPHEVEILAVSDLVPVDGESRHAHRVSFVFVVPAECGVVTRNAERDSAVRDFNCFKQWLAAFRHLGLRLPDLL